MILTNFVELMFNKDSDSYSIHIQKNNILPGESESSDCSCCTEVELSGEADRSLVPCLVFVRIT